MRTILGQTWYTLDETAELLGVGQGLIKKWIAAGELHPVKIGKQLILREDVETFLLRRRNEPTDQADNCKRESAEDARKAAREAITRMAAAAKAARKAIEADD